MKIIEKINERISECSLAEAYDGVVSFFATAKNGKKFFQNDLQFAKKTEKALLVTTFEQMDKSINTWLPISQIKRITCYKNEKTGWASYSVEIPMWLFGKMFFENNA